MNNIINYHIEYSTLKISMDALYKSMENMPDEKLIEYLNMLDPNTTWDDRAKIDNIITKFNENKKINKTDVIYIKNLLMVYQIDGWRIN